MKPPKRSLFFVPMFFLTVVFYATCLLADTVTLKSGRKIEGTVEREDANGLELNVGYGTVTFSKKEVLKVTRTTPEQSQQLWNEWDQMKKDRKAKGDAELAVIRERRDREYTQMIEELKRKASVTQGSGQKIATITRGKNIYVKVLFNNKIEGTLIVDTGAAYVTLSQNIARKLGIDFTDSKLKKIKLQVADGRTVDAVQVLLDSVKVGEAEAGKVEAAIHLSEQGDEKKSDHDGLLGMAFLKRYYVKLDPSDNGLILEEPEKNKAR